MLSSKKTASRDRALTDEILKLRLRATDLGREIAEGEAQIETAQNQLAQQFIPSTPDQTLVDRATAALAATEATVRAKLNALAEIERQIEANEQELSAVRDADTRKRSVEELDGRERRFEAAGSALIAALEAYHVAAGDIGPLFFEAQQLSKFAGSLAVGEIPTANEMLSAMISNYKRDIQSGVAPAALPQRHS